MALNFVDGKFVDANGTVRLDPTHADIKKYANTIENRLDDDWCTMESVLADNTEIHDLALRYKVNYILIEDKYEINIDL